MNIGKESDQAIQVEPLVGPPLPAPKVTPVPERELAPVAKVEQRELVTA